MTIYSVQPRDRIFVKSHGFLSFAKNLGKDIGKNISKNLTGKYSKNGFDHDEIYEMLHQVREIDIMHSIIVKKGVFFFITTTEEIALDIKQFCCGANASILGVDATFNLCNMWVTYTCYHNKRVVNRETGNNPIF